jgi:hypothetical protein
MFLWYIFAMWFQCIMRVIFKEHTVCSFLLMVSGKALQRKIKDMTNLSQGKKHSMILDIINVQARQCF